MAVESAADRLAFLSTGDWGITATVGGSSVTALLSDDYVESLGGVGTHPVLLCRTADVSGVAEGAAVVAAGTSYTVALVQAHAEGMTALVLREV